MHFEFIWKAFQRRSKRAVGRKRLSAKRKTPESARLQAEDMNAAFLMLKPHANNAAARAFVEDFLGRLDIDIFEAHCLSVLRRLRQSGSISAKEMEDRRGEFNLMYPMLLYYIYILQY